MASIWIARSFQSHSGSERSPKGKGIFKNKYDDVIAFSLNREDHLVHLREVFLALAEYGLHVNLRKCQLALVEVIFLDTYSVRKEYDPIKRNLVISLNLQRLRL